MKVIQKNEPDWTEELRRIRARLGEEEINRRIAAMDSYDTYETIAHIHDVAIGGQPMTPDQTMMWGRLAATFHGAVVFGGNIKRRLSDSELAYRVCCNELAARIDKENPRG